MFLFFVHFISTEKRKASLFQERKMICFENSMAQKTVFHFEKKQLNKMTHLLFIEKKRSFQHSEWIQCFETQRMICNETKRNECDVRQLLNKTKLG